MSIDRWDLARMAFESVCAGRAAATASEDPVEVYAGNVEYRLTNGWTVVVFNDCGEWDYIDSMISPDGDKLDYEDQPEYDSDQPRFFDRLEPCGKDGCPHWGWYQYLYHGPPPEWVAPDVKKMWDESYTKGSDTQSGGSEEK